jgi:hypothetical protein
LDGGGVGRTVDVSGLAEIANLTLANGYSTGNGGNLGLYTSAWASLAHVRILDGTAARGGNVSCERGTLYLSDVDIDGGAATSYGGGFYGSGCILHASHTDITSNAARTGGGMYTGGDRDELSDTNISDNSATSGGGGIAQAGGTKSLTLCTVSGNTAGSVGGGVYLLAGGTLTLETASNVRENTAASGGGVYVAGSAGLTCTGSARSTGGIWGNTAVRGGGAYLGDTTATITSSTCDWTGTIDNSGYDSWTSLSNAYTKEDDETFTCTAGGC